ncbi:MAG: DUF1549 and DUF1553 domain-containing protein [Gemmataceae bacterium]
MSLRWPALLAVCLLATPARADDSLAKYDALVRPQDRQHWAFQAVRPMAPPPVRDQAWVRNPIDAFVLSKLEARGWRPGPRATPHALLRRIYLDLTGLPPTLDEQDAFTRDTRPDRWERLVDRLLASPAHGERYARHWLDVARYGDTNGYERDADKPGSWRYRDRVIASLNDDLPFDRFLVEQLAGDEMPGAHPGSRVATGFLRLGPWDDEPADPKTDRFDQLDDLVSATSEAFLGLTLACARCHNHKFEPLTMHDYYRMVAVFDPLQRPRDGRTELDRPAVPPQERARILASEKRLAALRKQGAAGQAEADRLQRELAAVPRGYFLEETPTAVPVTHLLRRGRADAPGAVVQPGLPAVLVPTQPAFLPATLTSTQRRLTLAQWMVRRDNPLTPRVIVNRVWQWHFGEGLVRTPNDFGTRGQAPTHPELLDWLAGWFVEQGWNLKALHRLIVTSNTYQMSRAVHAEYQAADPENRLLWRFPVRRLEAETIRDGMLAVSGRLSRNMGGPGVRPAIPRAALEGHSDPNTVWKADAPDRTERRSVYIHVKRSLPVPMLEVLDTCDTTRSAAQRLVTTVAPQALVLFNGDFTNEQARHLAERLAREAGPDDTARFDIAYRLLLARSPREREVTLLRDYLGQQRRNGLAPEAAWSQVCRVLLNLNEFVYPD